MLEFYFLKYITSTYNYYLFLRVLFSIHVELSCTLFSLILLDSSPAFPLAFMAFSLTLPIPVAIYHLIFLLVLIFISFHFLSTSSLFFMAYHWIPPPPGTLKINVHALYSDSPIANGNISGIGIIFRDHNGFLKLNTLGVIPNLSPMGNQL